MGGGWVGCALSKFFWDFVNFAKPLNTYWRWRSVGRSRRRWGRLDWCRGAAGAAGPCSGRKGSSGRVC